MDIDASTLEAALRKLPELPTPVESWLVETGSDSTGDTAVWVWAMLEDDDVEFAKRSQLRAIISDLVKKKTGPYILVYVRFRGASEVEHSA